MVNCDYIIFQHNYSDKITFHYKDCYFSFGADKYFDNLTLAKQILLCTYFFQTEIKQLTENPFKYGVILRGS